MLELVSRNKTQKEIRAVKGGKREQGKGDFEICTDTRKMYLKKNPVWLTATSEKGNETTVIYTYTYSVISK